MARFLHLTDLHLVAAGTLVSSRLDTAGLMARAIDIILARMPQIGPLDAVLVTGDVSDDGSVESYRIACEQLDRLGLPVLAVPGNHDRRAPFRAAFNRWQDLPEEGSVDWAVEIGATTLIGLDTLVEGQGGGRLTTQTLAHLSTALATAEAAAERAGEAAASRQIVIAMHHPPLRTGIGFMDAIGLENRAAFAEILAATRTPVRILAGHVHSVFHAMVGAHMVVTGPAICSGFALDYRDDAPAGFWTGPTGYAILEMGAEAGPGGVWTAQSLDQGEGPFTFR